MMFCTPGPAKRGRAFTAAISLATFYEIITLFIVIFPLFFNFSGHFPFFLIRPFKRIWRIAESPGWGRLERISQEGISGWF
jgi:hypothetical protein